MSNTDRKQLVADFLNDFEAAGGWVNRDLLALAWFEDMGYGAVALSDIPVDEPLFHIPIDRFLISSNSDLTTKLSRDEIASLGSGWSPLILSMMWETSKASESPFAYYLNSLPVDFDTPIFWDASLLKELVGTDIEKRIGHAEAEQEFAQKLEPILQASGQLAFPNNQSRPDLFPSDSVHFSLEAFHLHGSRILSRSFTIPGDILVNDIEDDVNSDNSLDSDDEENLITAMIPLADMLNAACDQDNARLYINRREVQGLPDGLARGYSMVATKHIKKGDQIYNTYASPPNSDLLRKYGHVDEFPLTPSVIAQLEPEWIGNYCKGNPADEVELEGSLIVDSIVSLHPALAPSLPERLDRWLEEGEDDSFYLSFAAESDKGPAAFATVLSNTNAWERFRKKGKIPHGAIPTDVQQILSLAIRSRLNRYDCDLQTDLALLPSLAHGKRRRAIIVRIGEKRILLAALKRLERSTIAGASMTSKRADTTVHGVNKRSKVSS